MGLELNVFPNPVFEGSEKRIEVSFDSDGSAYSEGLRLLSRAQLDEILGRAACCIVSSRSNDIFDAYVLSESSLFVYKDRLILKTCGTTRLLSAVPLLLEYARSLGLNPCRCKYTRACYLFPEKQPSPHSSFSEEIEALQGYFGHILEKSRAYVLGDWLTGLRWHVYVAGKNTDACVLTNNIKPTYTLEVCMTGLHPEKAEQFYRGGHFVDAATVTEKSGIRSLVPKADLDDYVFDPCGYSMNGVQGAGFITIHITPEPGFSYASVEFCGFPVDQIDPQVLVGKVTDIFHPDFLAVAMSVDMPGRQSWTNSFTLPSGYDPLSGSTQQLFCGGCVAYHTMELSSHRKHETGSPRSVLRQACLTNGTGFVSSSSSPVDSDADTAA